MSREPLDRAAVGLGAAGVIAVIMVLTNGDPWQLVRVGPVASILTVVLGGVAIAGGRLGRPPLILAAGAGYLGAALLQLVQFGRSSNWVGGDGSTFSFFLGLGVGLIVVATTRSSITEHVPNQP
ncbi:MAG: hypothetical protein ABIM89_02625 [Mycobacteriales bacterium]